MVLRLLKGDAGAVAVAAIGEGGEVNLAICHLRVLPAKGGCETYAVDLLRRLAQDGHQVHLYANEWDAAAIPAGVRTHRVVVPFGLRCTRPWRFSRALAAMLPAGGHDLSIGFDKVAGVDVQYPAAGLYVATVRYGLNRHRAAWLRGLASFTRRFDPAYWSFTRFERQQFLGGAGTPPFLIANSEFVRRHFRRYLGVPAERVAVLHCAIDPDRFAAIDRPARRAATRESWRVEPSDTVALFVAMNYRLKGLGPLLHAVARLPVPTRSRFRLAVVGSPQTAPYQRLAHRLGISNNVRLLGFSADPRNAYFAADLLVHPTFYDPCSLVVQEARACGLPVVTTRYNGAAELLDPPNDGLVVRDPNDADELSAALASFLDPVKRLACARAVLEVGSTLDVRGPLSATAPSV